jgi:CDP-glucose 4,6-dehydratase
VLVTGATGFVGSWLTAALVRAGAEVVALVRDRPPCTLFDLLDLPGQVTTVSGAVEDLAVVERALNEYEVETCFHLAAQAIVGAATRSPLSTFETNVRGTWTVLEACRRVPGVARVVVASSDKAYGEQPSLPYLEETPLEGRFAYDASKACADVIARSYAATYDLPVTVSRCANIYGGGDLNFSRMVPGTIRSALRGEPPLIRSDGTPVRDYLYVEDAVEAYLLLGERADAPGVRGEAFNFGTAEPVPVLALVREILEAAGAAGLEPRVMGTASHELSQQFLSSAKAEKLLGWRPLVPRNEGLRRAVTWYRDFLANDRGGRLSWPPGRSLHGGARQGERRRGYAGFGSDSSSQPPGDDCGDCAPGPGRPIGF